MQSFICPKDEEGQLWGDKIVWNGTNYKYHDTQHNSKGTLQIERYPNGLTGPIEYQTGDKILYTSRQSQQEYPGIIIGSGQLIYTIKLDDVGQLREIQKNKQNNMNRLRLHP